MTVALTQRGDDLVAQVTSEDMCRATQTGKFALREVRTKYRDDGWMDGMWYVLLFVGAPTLIGGLLSNTPWLTDIGIITAGVPLASAVIDYMHPWKKIDQRFTPTRDGTMRWDGNYAPCPGASPVNVANATVTFSWSWEWGGTNMFVDVNTDANGVAVAPGYAAHTARTAVYCGDGSANAFVKGVPTQMQDNPAMPDGTVVSTVGAVGIGPTRTDSRDLHGLSVYKTADEAGMNAPEIAALEECANWGACNRCDAKCKADDTQDANGCEKLSYQNEADGARCYESAIKQVSDCYTSCHNTFCWTPDVAITKQVTIGSPGDLATLEPALQGNVITSHITGWSLGYGTSVVKACAKAKSDVFIAIEDACHGNTLKYLVYSPACTCDYYENQGWKCTETAQAVCGDDKNPQMSGFTSALGTDEASTSAAVIANAKSQWCNDVQLFGCISSAQDDGSGTDWACFAGATCPVPWHQH
jgi:hypothetical protein